MDATAWWGVVGLAGFLVSTAIAVVLYFRQRRDPKLVSFIRGSTVVDRGESSEIEVRYAGRPVARVVRTEITIWNCGRGTVRRDDIPPLDPLRIEFPADTADLLDVVATSSSPANELEAVIDGCSIQLALHYLDPDQVVVIAVTHTGADPLAARVRGAVIGIGAVAHRDAGARSGWIQLLFVLSGFALSLGLMQLVLRSPVDTTDPVEIARALLSFGVAFLLGLAAALLPARLQQGRLPPNMRSA